MGTPSSLLRRTGAVAIDTLVFCACIALAYASVTYFQPFSEATTKELRVENLIKSTILFQIAALLFVFYVTSLHAWKSVTIGKWLFKLRLRNTDGSTVTLKDSIKRYAPYLVFQALFICAFLVDLPSAPDNAGHSALVFYLLLLWILASALSIIFTARKQALHDLIAKTVVIKV